MAAIPRSVALFCIAVLFISAFAVAPFIGESSVRVMEAVSNPDSMSGQILFSIRLPRILFTFVVGASLALVGSVFQALLRNDLATPYTLGVSSGGALGAVLAIKAGLAFSVLGFSAVSLSSIAGSLSTVLIIFAIARHRQGISTNYIILAGVTISLFFSALILFIHYLADFTETFRMVRWMMGMLDVTGWQYPFVLLLLLLACFGYFFVNVPAFNLVLAGSDVAKSKGVHVLRLQQYSFILGSVLVGAVVSLAGPIGFVGLIVPHVMRMVLGPDHRQIFPAMIAVGGAFLVWCDTLARIIIFPAELPVGIITSLLGGPFFLYILIRQKWA